MCYIVCIVTFYPRLWLFFPLFLLPHKKRGNAKRRMNSKNRDQSHAFLLDLELLPIGYKLFLIALVLNPLLIILLQVCIIRDFSTYSRENIIAAF